MPGEHVIRWATRAAAAGLLSVAAIVFFLQIGVSRGTSPTVTCGSAWDVVAGRMGWQEWWSADVSGAAGSAVRAAQCPGAVNQRIVTAGLVTLAAVVVLGAGEFARRARRPRPVGDPVRRRLRRLGTGLTALGLVLTAAGLIGLALLTADPHASLFLYVSRSVVVLCGLLLVLPAILIAVLGRGATLLADELAGPGRDEP